MRIISELKGVMAEYNAATLSDDEIEEIRKKRIILKNMDINDYTEIASFYDFHVYIKTDFYGVPCIYIKYDDDNLEGFFNLETRKYEAVDFLYVTGIIDEWIDEHYDILIKMWNGKSIDEEGFDILDSIEHIYFLLHDMRGCLDDDYLDNEDAID